MHHPKFLYATSDNNKKKHPNCIHLQDLTKSWYLNWMQNKYMRKSKGSKAPTPSPKNNYFVLKYHNLIFRHPPNKSYLCVCHLESTVESHDTGQTKKGKQVLFGSSSFPRDFKIFITFLVFLKTV